MKEWQTITNILTAITLCACGIKPAQPSQSTLETEIPQRTIRVEACYDGYTENPNGRCNDESDQPLEINFRITNITGKTLAQSKTSAEGKGNATITTGGQVFLAVPRTIIEQYHNGESVFACLSPAKPQFIPGNNNEISIELPYSPLFCNQQKPHEANAILFKHNSLSAGDIF